MKAVDCERCGRTFDFERPHTEIVRRDFVDAPEPAVVEYLCTRCWRSYVEEFLDEEFERELERPGQA